MHASFGGFWEFFGRPDPLEVVIYCLEVLSVVLKILEKLVCQESTSPCSMRSSDLPGNQTVTCHMRIEPVLLAPDGQCAGVEWTILAEHAAVAPKKKLSNMTRVAHSLKGWASWQKYGHLSRSICWHALRVCSFALRCVLSVRWPWWWLSCIWVLTLSTWSDVVMWSPPGRFTVKSLFLFLITILQRKLREYVIYPFFLKFLWVF